MTILSVPIDVADRKAVSEGAALAVATGQIVAGTSSKSRRGCAVQGQQPETRWHIVINRRDIWNSDRIGPIGFCGPLDAIVVIGIQVERLARVH